MHKTDHSRTSSIKKKEIRNATNSQEDEDGSISCGDNTIVPKKIKRNQTMKPPVVTPAMPGSVKRQFRDLVLKER